MAKRDLVKFDFNPFQMAEVSSRNLSQSQKKRILSEVKEYVAGQVVSDARSQLSSETGAKWKGLSKEYKARKLALGKGGVPNLRFEGSMLSAVRVVPKGDNELRLRVLADQQPKADGHANHSGRSKLPLRRFIPKDDFRPGIKARIKKIVGDGS